MNFWRDRNVFITGASGLLGSWLADALLERGARVVCLLRDWVPDSRFAAAGLLARCAAVHGALEDLPLLVRALNEHEIDSVFHLGAQTIVGTALRSPVSTFESNIRGTWNLLEACRTSRLVERIVVASSDKAYGAHQALPYTEETPLAGRFPYDVSKSCADMLCHSYFHSYGTPVAITRCGNLFGGGDLNFNRLIPTVIRSAMQDRRPPIRSDGTFVRDYFYVRDAVGAYLSLAERVPSEGITGEAFNFGTETPLSVLEMAGLVLKLMQKESLQPLVLNEAGGEIPRQFLDCSKARTRLGWKPVYTLEAALLETITWYRDALTASA